jgi:hypothetical protein
VLPVLPVFPVLPVAPGGPAGPGEQAPTASIITEATTNFEYITMVPHNSNGKNCSIVFEQVSGLSRLPLTGEDT